MRALTLLSGGLDSTTLVVWLQDKGYKVSTISIHYGQAHARQELGRAIEIAAQLGVDNRVISLPTELLASHESGLTGRREIPDVDYSELSGVSPSYVPFRNGTMISILAARAQAEGFDTIGIGVHADDAAQWAYPDCTPEFVGAMASAVYVGTYHAVRLVAPFTYMTKSEIVTLGDALDAPLGRTWSCYHGASDVQCGICPTCRSRREAFRRAGVRDRTPYKQELPA